ncbi:hypothetical protein BU26DRAFT_144462 [Trematosphaeria pertusa]|uniref:Uncharacterized protein n=1 Tax=Trematosphaeria pertusa TaxID=390896 RepID=A0A6A6IWR4_9PLEO|nr:uncharacterized protein BU26DRAFT_144462 [Trematosphaeria pertusa]KAF2254738.1 hypothetical protein BU26DRAFT_144462 [Trematosphaeria pertusa]
MQLPCRSAPSGRGASSWPSRHILFLDHFSFNMGSESQRFFPLPLEEPTEDDHAAFPGVLLSCCFVAVMEGGKVLEATGVTSVLAFWRFAFVCKKQLLTATTVPTLR